MRNYQILEDLIKLSKELEMPFELFEEYLRSSNTQVLRALLHNDFVKNKELSVKLQNVHQLKTDELKEAVLWALESQDLKADESYEEIGKMLLDQKLLIKDPDGFYFYIEG